MYKFLLVVSFCLLNLLLLVDASGQTKLPWACGDDKLAKLQQNIVPTIPGSRQRTTNVSKFITLRFYNTTTAISLLPKFAHTIAVRPRDSTYTIPVVIHIVYPEGQAPAPWLVSSRETPTTAAEQADDF